MSRTDSLNLTIPPLPSPDDQSAIREKAKKYSDAGYAVIVPEPGGGIFELATWIRGFKDIYVDLSWVVQQPCLGSFALRPGRW